jgi:hypothetical protein
VAGQLIFDNVRAVLKGDAEGRKWIGSGPASTHCAFWRD